VLCFIMNYEKNDKLMHVKKDGWLDPINLYNSYEDQILISWLTVTLFVLKMRMEGWGLGD